MTVGECCPRCYRYLVACVCATSRRDSAPSATGVRYRPATYVYKDQYLDYLRQCIQAAPTIPLVWNGEDESVRAFESKESLILYYCQLPGLDGQPYCDRAFYCRELARVSKLVRPRLAVEFGTCQGISTCLLGWLNPEAKLITVDFADAVVMPTQYGETFERQVEVGYLSKLQRLACDYVKCISWKFKCEGVDLCFVDAGSTYAEVLRDSVRAWLNRSTDGHPWAIVWDNYSPRLPGIVRAVDAFCQDYEMVLNTIPDSDTVWVWGNMP